MNRVEKMTQETYPHVGRPVYINGSDYHPSGRRVCLVGDDVVPGFENHPKVGEATFRHWIIMESLFRIPLRQHRLPQEPDKEIDMLDSDFHVIVMGMQRCIVLQVRKVMVKQWIRFGEFQDIVGQ